MWKSGLKWIFLILGTMIGAGYASGRELWQFFGKESGLAILLFTIIFSICCYVIMKISFEEKTEHFYPVLVKLVGNKLSKLYDVIIVFYLFTTTVVMLAGGGATIEMFHLPFWFGIALFSVLLVVLFIWNIKGLISMNVLLIPLLIAGLLVTLITFISVHSGSWGLDHLNEQANWPSAFTFTALNILPLIAVLAAIGREVKQKGEIMVASIGSGVALGIISFIYNQSLLQVAGEILLYEIPLFAILNDYPYSMIILMSVLLWFAIFTTAASGMLGLTSRFSQSVKMPVWLFVCLLLVLMVPLTRFGFSTLVAILYPLYGLINLYLLVAVLIYPIANRYKW